MNTQTAFYLMLYDKFHSLLYSLCTASFRTVILCSALVSLNSR